MIGRMKKLTVLCLESDRDSALNTLQDIGVLHLEPLQAPAGTDLDETRGLLADIAQALEALEAVDAPPTTEERETVSPEQALKEVWNVLNHRTDYRESLEYWQREIARMAPFGSFDPAQVQTLESKQFYLQLYKAGAKQILDVPETATLTIHQTDPKNGTWFSVLSREPLELPYESIKLPRASLSDMRVNVTQLEQALARTQRDLQEVARHHRTLESLRTRTEDELAFLEARAGVGTAGPVLYLRGYAPENEVPAIQQAAARSGWGLRVEEVTDEDRVPTKIENPRWVEPIRTVFNFIGVVPGYHEVDISGIFLVFFSLFFAMIVGDAGYGALFLGATWWGARKFAGKAPSSVFHLLYITSIATIVWGMLTGNYFGIKALPSALTSVKIDWLNETENIMLVCFLIGAIHLTIAHGWNVRRLWPKRKAWAQVGWIGIVWTMFFLARFLVLNADFPMIMVPVFVVGLIMLILFMTPFEKIKTDWIDHVMLPLNLVSNFVDVVSYVRLFAVGTATLAVASAFNGMAQDIGAGGGLGTVFAVLIIFLGHTLNILLAAMGVLVHGIRLNTLEFAGHVGMQWTGTPYRPFARKTVREGVEQKNQTESQTA